MRNLGVYLIAATCELKECKSAGSGGPLVEVLSDDPKDLLFMYYGESGKRALFHWGIGNGVLQRALPKGNIPGLEVPAVTVVYLSQEGTVPGVSYIAVPDRGGEPGDELARLVGRLDFTEEFLRLSRLPRADGTETAAARSRKAQELEAFTEGL